MIKLLWANIKMTFRDKQAMFWSLAFPLIFIFLFGLFDFTKMGNANYIIYDNANTELSQEFSSGLENIEFLKKIEAPDVLEEAKEMMAAGDVDVVIVVPEDFKLPEMPEVPVGLPPGMEIPPTPDISISPIQIFYDEANITVNQVALSVVDKFVDQMNMQAANAPSLFSYDTENIQSKEVNYIDIIMPGILGMAIMMSAIIGISTGISQYRERKLLKRLSATPLKVRTFLIAEVLSFLFMNIIQITLIILVAKIFFDVNVYGNYLLIYMVGILGSISFLNIGFAVAGYSKNVKTAEALSQVVAMPMMMLSGVFFPSDILPKFLAGAVEYLPLTPVIKSLREIALNAGSFEAISTNLLYIGAWIIISFFLAWWLFKFKD